MIKAKISEVFHSIQGEGKYTGREQVFVRFFECNMRCVWCDTPNAIGDTTRHYQEYSLEELLSEVRGLYPGCHSVSLTGGEPLAQKDFIKELLPSLIIFQLRSKEARIKETEKKQKYLKKKGQIPFSATCNSLLLVSCFSASFLCLLPLTSLLLSPADLPRPPLQIPGGARGSCRKRRKAGAHRCNTTTFGRTGLSTSAPFE